MCVLFILFKFILFFFLSEQSTDVTWQFFDLSGVELFQFSQSGDVFVDDEVDSNTLSTETTTSTDSVDVVFLVCWQVVVDNQGNLLDIDTSGQQVSGDQNSGRTGSELLHDGVSFLLWQVGVDGRDGEVVSGQSLGQLFDLTSGVTEDNGLGNGDRVVQVGQTVVFELFFLDVDEELLDTFQGQFVLLNQDSNWVVHELGCDFQDVSWHGGGQQDNLGGWWQHGENLVDLLLETGGQHFIGFVQDEHLDVVDLELTPLDVVEHTTWGTDDDLRVSQTLGVLDEGGTTDTGVDLDVHVETKRHDDLLDLQGQFSGWSQH